MDLQVGVNISGKSMRYMCVHIYWICRIEYISMGNICPYLWDRVYIYWKYMSISMDLQVGVNISGKSMRYMCVHIYWICRMEYISIGNIFPYLWDRVYIYWKYMSISMDVQVGVNISGKSMRYMCVHIYWICRIEYISMGNICPYLWDRVYIYWKYMSISMYLQIGVNISGKSMRYMCVHIYLIYRIEYISMGNICPYLWDRVYIYWKYMSISMDLQVGVNISGKSMRYMCVHIY